MDPVVCLWKQPECMAKKGKGGLRQYCSTLFVHYFFIFWFSLQTAALSNAVCYYNIMPRDA